MKARILFLTAVCALCLAGCGSNEKVIGGEVNNQTTGGNSGAQATQPAAGDQGEVSQKTEAKGYTFVYQDCVMAMDTDMAPVLEKLGDPVSYFEAASCAFEGLDKMYTYNGFEVDTYPQGNKDLLSAVVLKDDSVATPEGIYIGSSQDDLFKAYGEDYAEENGMLVYKKDGMKLCFIVNDNSVSSIQYFSTVLDE